MGSWTAGFIQQQEAAGVNCWIVVSHIVIISVSHRLAKKKQLPRQGKLFSTPSRARTCDRLLKRQLLYQLSYGRIIIIFLVAGVGIEPTTLALWVPRSNQLSYPARAISAPVRIRTQNTWSEAKRDIHFTTGANSDFNRYFFKKQFLAFIF